MQDRFISKELSNSIEQAFEEWSFSENPVYEATIKPDDNGIFRQILSSSGNIHSSIFKHRVKVKGTPIEHFSNPTTENNEPLYFLAEKFIFNQNGALFLTSKVKLSRFTTNKRNHEFTLRTSYSDYRSYLNLDWQVVDFSKTNNTIEQTNPIITTTPTVSDSPIIIPENKIQEPTIKCYSQKELSDLINEKYRLSTYDFKGDIYMTENYRGLSISSGKFDPSFFSNFTFPIKDFYPMSEKNSITPEINKGTPLGFSVFINPNKPDKYLAGRVFFNKVIDNQPKYTAILETNDKSWVKTQKLDRWIRYHREDL